MSGKDEKNAGEGVGSTEVSYHQTELMLIAYNFSELWLSTAFEYKRSL